MSKIWVIEVADFGSSPEKRKWEPMRNLEYAFTKARAKDLIQNECNLECGAFVFRAVEYIPKKAKP